jgi:hypothetical protein
MDLVYWDAVRFIAKWLHADGCSSISQVYMEPCLEHDIHYKTRQWAEGWISGRILPITRAQADWQMLLATMSRSPARVLTPIGWLRWIALRVAGWKAWRDNAAHPLPAGLPPLEVLR